MRPPGDKPAPAAGPTGSVYRDAMTRIEVQRVIPAGLERVWQLLTVPDEMNRWSEATILEAEPGRRRVSVPFLGFRMRLEERILEVEPPRRFVYSVVSGGGLRAHRGVQTFERLGDGATRLHWVVRFEPWIPGTGRILRALLLPKLERSLAVLERIARES